MTAIIGKTLKLPQDKGPEVELVAFGDEFYGRYETKDGYSAMYDDGRGLYTYADIANGKYISTGVSVLQEPPRNLEPHLKEAAEVRQRKAAQRFEDRSL